MSISCRKVSHTGSGKASSTTTKPSRCNFKSTSSVIFVDLNELHHHEGYDIQAYEQKKTDKQQLWTQFVFKVFQCCILGHPHEWNKDQLDDCEKRKIDVCMTQLEKWGYTIPIYNTTGTTGQGVMFHCPCLLWRVFRHSGWSHFLNLKPQTKKVLRMEYGTEYSTIFLGFFYITSHHPTSLLTRDNVSKAFSGSPPVAVSNGRRVVDCGSGHSVPKGRRCLSSVRCSASSWDGDIIHSCTFHKGYLLGKNDSNSS